MTADERAELLARQFEYRAEAEARAQAAAQPADPPTVLDPPIENRQARWEREGLEQADRERRERAARARREAAAATPAPAVDWAGVVRDAIASEREHMMQLLEQAIVEIETRADRRIADEVRPLTIEIAELKVSNARLREALLERGGSVGSSAGMMSALN